MTSSRVIGLRYLDRVADRPDVLVAGSHVLVDADASELADLETGLDREGDLGLDAHTEYDQIGRDPRASLQTTTEAAAR